MKSDIKYIITIDAGGSFFKSAIIDSNGMTLDGSMQKVPVDSNADSENILLAYERIIKNSLDLARKSGKQITGVGISVPGPFDYQNCRSHMTHKFKSIYGIDLKEEIQKRCDLPEGIIIKFLHDAHAFILGEHWQGEGRGFAYVAGVTIGTGLGFGCIIDNKIFHDGKGGPYISLFRKPYKDGILEDVISKRGIIKLYKNLAGIDNNISIDVVDIGRLAETKEDEFAIQTFNIIGRVLAENIADLLSVFKIECLILGGQICKSYNFMKDELGLGLRSIKSLKKVCVAQNIDNSALIGAARAVFDSEIYMERNPDLDLFLRREYQYGQA